MDYAPVSNGGEGDPPFGSPAKAAPAAAHAKPSSSAQRGLDVLSTSETGGFTFGDPLSPVRPGPFRVDNIKLGALQARALAEGGLIYSPSGDSRSRRVAWMVCGKGRDQCTSPVEVLLIGGERTAPPMGLCIELHTRCRKCEACRKAKAAYWKLRAMAEIGRASRTWFVTLTWAPENRVRAEYAMRNPNASGEERVRELRRVLGPEVTRWRQRLRKGLRTGGEDPVSFRYHQVWEEHQDGFPHVHLLLHEKPGQTVTKRRIQREWRGGFSNCRLVESMLPEHIHRDAAYVCKYIAKAMVGYRVPASLHYGEPQGSRSARSA